MKIIRYQSSPVFSPARNFIDLRDEMDRLFSAGFPAPSSRLSGEEVGGKFPIDLYQEKDAFLVRAELPGFRREDLNVEVSDGTLTVSGQQKSEKSADEKAEVTPERRVSRSITLPEQVRVDAIQARYENGVLTVTLPKREEAKPRQIVIDVK